MISKLSKVEMDCEGLIRQSAKDYVLIRPDDFNEVVHELTQGYSEMLGKSVCKGILEIKTATAMANLIGTVLGELYCKIFNEEEENNGVSE